MGAGRAHGINREYQVLCRNVLCGVQGEDELRPYEEDGIDVAVWLGGTERTFDVALMDKHSKVIVAECKRTVGPVRLADFDAFAYRVESLRKETGKEVAGVYFAKS